MFLIYSIIYSYIIKNTFTKYAHLSLATLILNLKSCWFLLDSTGYQTFVLKKNIEYPISEHKIVEKYVYCKSEITVMSYLSLQSTSQYCWGSHRTYYH